MRVSIGLQAKLLAMVGAVTVILIVGGFIVHTNLTRLFKQQQRQATAMIALSSLKDLQATLVDANLNAMDIIVDRQEIGDGSFRVGSERLDKLNELRTFLTSKKAPLEQTAQIFRMEQDLAFVWAGLTRMELGTAKLIADFEQGKNDFSALDNEIDQTNDDANRVLAKMRMTVEKDFEEARVTLNSVAQNVQYLYYFVSILSVLALFVLGVPTVVVISRSMRRIQHQLASATQEIRNSSESLAAASQKMAGSATQSAAAIQESVSSMAEMTAMLGQTSQHTAGTATVAQEVMGQAQDGTHIMEQMSSSIRRIAEANSRLQQIVKIIEDINQKTNIINEIVFKTQLLAVNASIEAARAGIHGKGFAVVANEVGNLANLSGKAAAEIRSLLQASSGQVSEIIAHTSETVREGEHVSQQAVSAFTGIAKGVSEISGKLSQINDASKEQELGIRQTSTALTQMNEATAANSAVARENAALGLSLRTQVDRLLNVGRAMAYVVNGAAKEAGEHTSEKRRMSRFDQILASDQVEQDKVISLQTYREGLAAEASGFDETKRDLAVNILTKAMGRRDQLPHDLEPRAADVDRNSSESGKIAS